MLFFSRKIKLNNTKYKKEGPPRAYQQGAVTCWPGHAAAFPLVTYFLSFYMVYMEFDPAEFDLKLCTFHITRYITFDTWFYWTHRAAHHPSIYRYVHKQHHEFYVPVSICAGYAHPLEDLVVNLGSTLVGPVLFPSHVYTWAIYYALRMHETIDAHSGYDFLGALGIIQVGSMAVQAVMIGTIRNRGKLWRVFFWDWVCGTDQGYKRYLAKQEKMKQEMKSSAPSTTKKKRRPK